jgi:hypothetical protein
MKKNSGQKSRATVPLIALYSFDEKPLIRLSTNIFGQLEQLMVGRARDPCPHALDGVSDVECIVPNIVL